VNEDSGRRAARALQPGAVIKERAGKAFFVSALIRANPQKKTSEVLKTSEV